MTTEPKSAPVWLIRLVHGDHRRRALAHRVATNDFLTLCGRRAPHGPGRFKGQPEAVQCPACQSAQKRL